MASAPSPGREDGARAHLDVRLSRALLAVIIAIALVLTWPGVHQPTGTAAPWMVKDALHWLRDTSVHADWVAYPTLVANLLTLLTIVYVLGAIAFGAWTVPLALALLTDWRVFMPLSGYLSMAFGVVAIAATYSLGRRVAGERTGLLAALLLALTPSFSRYCHEGTPDCAVTALSAVAMVLLLAVLRQPMRRNYVLCGLFIGLAIAAKYNAAVLAVVALAVHVYLLRKRGRPIWPILHDGAQWAALAGGLAFAVTSFQTVLQAKAFLRSVLIFERNYKLLAYSSTVSPDTFIPYISHLQVLFSLEGWVTLLWLAGIVWALLRRRDWQLVLLLTVGVALLYIGRWRMVIPRFYLFIFPALAVLAADAVVRAIGRARERGTRGWGTLAVLVGVAAVVCLGHSGLRVTRGGARMLEPTTQELSRDWIEANIPRGATIAGPSTPEGYPALLNMETVAGFVEHGDLLPDRYRPEVAAIVADWPVYDLCGLSFACEQAEFPESWPAEVRATYQKSVWATRTARICFSLQRLRAEGAQYIVTSGGRAEPYLQYSSADELPGYDPRAAHFDENRAFFLLLERVAAGQPEEGVSLAAEFPEGNEVHGPTIRVFRVESPPTLP